MFCYFELQSTFMADTSQQLRALQDIKQMMDKSSRFISLSGWSGISAGICALIGAAFGYNILLNENSAGYHHSNLLAIVTDRLFLVAVLTFIAAFILAFTFTYQRSRKNNLSLWGSTAKRLMDGNLASHLKTLEESGNVKVQKGFIGRKTNTIYWVTKAGEKDFKAHVDAFEQMIKFIS